MQELMKDGRKGVKEIDGTLSRAEKLVEDTLQIGQQVRGWAGCCLLGAGGTQQQAYSGRHDKGLLSQTDSMPSTPTKAAAWA